MAETQVGKFGYEERARWLLRFPISEAALNMSLRNEATVY